jgi:hypothetical protein
MIATIELQAEIKSALVSLAPVFRHDQMPRDDLGNITKPLGEDGNALNVFFVLTFVTGTPEQTQQRFQKDTLRLAAWADNDSNRAAFLLSQAETRLRAVHSLGLRNVVYNGYDTPYHGWSREVYAHE